MVDYDIVDLLLDIGGILGLWMGISILIIMELVEFAIRLVVILFKSENRYFDYMDDYSLVNGILEYSIERAIYF